jgi:hypothetical protein
MRLCVLLCLLASPANHNDAWVLRISAGASGWRESAQVTTLSCSDAAAIAASAGTADRRDTQPSRTVSGDAGQAVPPPDAARKTLYVRSAVPPPQVLVQSDQAPQLPARGARPACPFRTPALAMLSNGETGIKWRDGVAQRDPAESGT